MVAIGLVAALGGAGVFIATRGSSSKDAGAQAGGSQTNGSAVESQMGGSTIGSQSGSQAIGSTVGSQAEAERAAGAAKAEASGLTLSYRVLAKPAAGGDFRVVKPGEQLHTDDRLAFEVMVSEQAHVFLSQRPKGKSLAVLFPNAGIDVTNPLPPKTWTRIPSGTRSFRINDKDVGLETVYFIASRVPPPSLAAAIANEGKPGAKQHAVEEQIVAVAMEKRDDCVGRGREIVLDGEDDCKVKTRGLELDDEKDAKRVRGMTMDEVVFVPFAFQHAAKRDAVRTPDRPSPPASKPDTAPIRETAPAAPTSLSAGVFRGRMQAVAGKAQACYAGTEGSAKVKLTIAPTGEVTKVVVTGVGQAEATCVEDAVKAAKFPPWEGGAQTFNYSYLLSD